MERLLYQGKHDAFLFVEVNATGVQAGLQPSAGFWEILDRFHLFQNHIDFLMVMIQTGQSVLILQNMIESDIGQVSFRPAVVVEEPLQEAAKSHDFAQCLDAGQCAFNLVEQGQEHPMLRHQALDNSNSHETNITLILG